jgi:hypothetical protein
VQTYICFRLWYLSPSSFVALSPRSSFWTTSLPEPCLPTGTCFFHSAGTASEAWTSSAMSCHVNLPIVVAKRFLPAAALVRASTCACATSRTSTTLPAGPERSPSFFEPCRIPQTFLIEVFSLSAEAIHPLAEGADNRATETD